MRNTIAFLIGPIGFCIEKNVTAPSIKGTIFTLMYQSVTKLVPQILHYLQPN